MISIKSGVRVAGMSPEALLAIVVARDVFTECSEKALVITSITDGDHKAGSLHHTGRAIDLRLPASGYIGSIVATLRSRLPGYDVVIEKDHIHVEYDPK